jgi:hypothetical protein
MISFFADGPLGQAIVKVLTNKIGVAILVVAIFVSIVALSGLA